MWGWRLWLGMVVVGEDRDMFDVQKMAWTGVAVVYIEVVVGLPHDIK